MAEFFTPSTTGEGQGGAQILSADTAAYAFCGAVFADMDAGDTAIIRIYQEGGTSQTDVNISSVFTGHLLG